MSARTTVAPSPVPPGGAVDTPPDLARRLAAELFERSGIAAVLDPACGEGALLLAALELSGGDPAFAERGLFGIELDPRRAARARERLLKAAAPRADAAGRDRIAAALERHVVCGDGLDPDLRWPGGTRVLANPPWQSLSGRHTASIPAERLARYRKSWTAFGAGWPSVHGAFLERIACHLELGGGEALRARVLIPSATCDLERYEPTRAAVLEHARLEVEPVQLGEGAFPGITQPTALLALVGGPPSRANPSAAWVHRKPAEGSEDGCAGELLACLAGARRLPPGTFADPGVHTGNAARELVFDRLPADLPPGVALAPVRVGRDLTPYGLAEPTRWLRTDLVRGGGRRFRIPPLERLSGFPILLRQTATRPVAALHTAPTYFRNSLLACRGAEGLDPAVLVAVLNSPLLAAWHRREHRDARQRTFPQVKVAHLADLPVPLLHRDESPRLHDELAARVRALRPESAGFERDVAELEQAVERAFTR